MKRGSNQMEKKLTSKYLRQNILLLSNFAAENDSKYSSLPVCQLDVIWEVTRLWRVLLKYKPDMEQHVFKTQKGPID